ncbi:DNA-directed RNA polymerase, subunit M/Transcription elongation factor TFIIS [Thermoplasmatales archaeon BRNA1]|nr:DNA-directed RNA polymerase, subunit M/Transcription elongation factor TFIIS [Thermoplasmatales archaeon BRNA1]
MFPKDGKYVCRNPDCGYEEPISGNAQTFTTKAKNTETIVMEEGGATLPKARVTCPACGYTEAYYNVRQTRAADEPETIMYRCCKCNNRWNQY